MSDPYSPDTYDLRDAPESSSPSFREGLHPVNIGHLVMGVAFAGLTIIWALFISDTVQGHDLRWLLPIPWVAAGVAGLVAAAPRMRGSRD